MCRVEEVIDTILIEDIGCYYNSEKLKVLRKKEIPASPDVMFLFGKQIFNLICNENRPILPNENYSEFCDGRVCVVSHKIFEKDPIATYIIESSVNNNGSFGCPSHANYYTYFKSDGRMLNMKDVLQQVPKDELITKLKYKDITEKVSQGYKPADLTLSGEELLMDGGCASIKKGVLIYFNPYHLGCGAEG